MLQARVKPFSHVLSPEANQAIDRLWDVAWNLLKGENSQSHIENERSEGSYKFCVNWSVWDQEFCISSIDGMLSKRAYRIDLIGVVERFEIVSEELECRYVFTSDSKYGSFSTPDSACLMDGSSFYSLNSESHRTKWLMTAEKESEAIAFINRLCDAIATRELGSNS